MFMSDVFRSVSLISVSLENGVKGPVPNVSYKGHDIVSDCLGIYTA